MSNERQITSTQTLDTLFVNFPLWFPITYIFLALNFPSFSKILFILSLFLFAETHFASTWLFFFDKENWSWIKKNFYDFIYLPCYLLIAATLLWIFNPSFLVIIHYLASGWHVTKQSAGITKLYGLNNRFNEFLIYFTSFLFLFIGIRNPGLLSSYLNISSFNYLFFGLISIYFLILYLNFYGRLSKIIANLMPVFTGISIYLPILFFRDLATATAIGVGMHWCQYISIVWSTYLRKKNRCANTISFKTSSRLLFIFSYSLVMTTLAVIGMPNLNNDKIQYSFIYLIPLLFQLYHFYIDGFIWKFSDPHIRESVLKYIYKPMK